ncbi:MAG: hypothetical protein ACRDGM_20435 [bacterium]
MAGSGQIREYTTYAPHLAALLYDFDIGSPILKPRHRDWLNTNVPSSLTADSSVLIVGLASRTGSDAFNLSLSKLRALSVENLIQGLAAAKARPLVDLSVALGEEAARIAGLKDGVEDERWRGVFLNIGQQPAVLRNRYVKLVKRRTHVKVITEDKPGKIMPMDPQDARAERIFQASRKVTARLGMVENIVAEDSELINEDWTAVTITLKRSTGGSDLYMIEYLDVHYDWGPFTGTRTLIVKTPDKYRRIDPGLGDERLPMSADQMNEWLTHPLKTYIRSGRL